MGRRVYIMLRFIHVFLSLVFLLIVKSASLGSNYPRCEPVSNFENTFYKWYADEPKVLKFINQCVFEWNCDRKEADKAVNPNCGKTNYHCDYDNPNTDNGTVHYTLIETLCGHSDFDYMNYGIDDSMTNPDGCFQVLYEEEYMQFQTRYMGYSTEDCKKIDEGNYDIINEDY